MLRRAWTAAGAGCLLLVALGGAALSVWALDPARFIGREVVLLHGGLGRAERQAAIDRFVSSRRALLLATDAPMLSDRVAADPAWGLPHVMKAGFLLSLTEPAEMAAAQAHLDAGWVPAGTSIMRAAREAGIGVPKLCATDSVKAFGS